ncbi:MAG: ATP-binding protein [Bacteroidetes bacterium]|nr:ATP-binding protein [Bacteroidota bacterium]
MEYSKLYFNKPLLDLTFNDVKKFFEESKQESDKLEFKSYNPRGNFEDKLFSICQCVSAFLNSEGGLLIWGAPEGKRIDGKKEKVFQGELQPIDRILEKDATINSISDQIIATPSNIRLNIIEHNQSCLCVFEVDRSNYTPHQLRDKYYMRLDGQTRPAPHYYVEAMFKKIRFPNLEGFIRIDSIGQHHNGFFIKFSYFVFNYSQFQNETNLTVGVVTDTGYYDDYNSPINIGRFSSSQVLLLENTKEVLHYGSPFVDQDMIIISSTEIMQGKTAIKLILSFGGRKSPLKYSLYELEIADPNLDDPNSIIKSSIENKMISDAEEELKISKTEQLKAVLGRDVETK